MSPFHEVILDKFHEYWGEMTHRMGIAHLHGEPAERVFLAFQFIQDSYQQPTRHYHGLSHIVDMLDQAACMNTLCDSEEIIFNYNAMQLAIFFHDAVYDVSSKTNEEDSAAKLSELLSLIVDEPTMVLAREMILASKGHEASGNPEVDLFLDIDMSILGRPWGQYYNYSMGIMDEYEPVFGIDAYVKGRCELFLKPMLARERIFLTEPYAQYDAQAKQNFEAELDVLTPEPMLWMGNT